MWTDWPISRVIFLFTGLALLLIFIQVTLFHYRQNFRRWAMWLPVLGSPAVGLVALWLTVNHSPGVRNVAVIFLIVGAIAGLIGFLYHFRGVGQRVGGYKMSNFLVGPPIILPLMITALSALGLIAVYWR
jgi:lysylphosphatidylglycerol synthetase-like protein (DUF2156 family)